MVIFTAVKNRCILHGRVFVMYLFAGSFGLLGSRPTNQSKARGLYATIRSFIKVRSDPDFPPNRRSRKNLI